MGHVTWMHLSSLALEVQLVFRAHEHAQAPFSSCLESDTEQGWVPQVTFCCSCPLLHASSNNVSVVSRELPLPEKILGVLELSCS